MRSVVMFDRTHSKEIRKHVKRSVKETCINKRFSHSPCRRTVSKKNLYAQRGQSLEFGVSSLEFRV